MKLRNTEKQKMSIDERERIMDLDAKDEEEASFVSSTHWDANTRRLTWFTRKERATRSVSESRSVQADKICPSAAVTNGPRDFIAADIRARRRRTIVFSRSASFLRDWHKRVAADPASFYDPIEIRELRFALNLFFAEFARLNIITFELAVKISFELTYY